MLSDFKIPRNDKVGLVLGEGDLRVKGRGEGHGFE